MDEFSDRLRRKLEPTSIRRGLIRAGLFLAGYELLKGEILDGVRTFLSFPTREGVSDTSEYDRLVRPRGDSEFKSCCSWLVEAGALSPQQAAQVLEIRDIRNEIAHELPRFLIDPGSEIRPGLLEQMEHLITVLGRFWGRIAIDTDSAFDNRSVSDEDIKSGPALVMGHIMDMCRETTNERKNYP